MFFDNRIAEGITKTGQYIVRVVGEALDKHFKENFNPNKEYNIYSDTDSVVYDSLVYVNGQKIKIGELYEMFSSYVEKDDFNRNYVKPTNGDYITKSFNTKTEFIEDKQIKYVMKHFVKKEMFEITDSYGNSVVVTEDHSVIVKRNNSYISIKPKEILSADFLITINHEI